MTAQTFNPQSRQPIQPKTDLLNLETLKFTALMYLVEAGRNEDYEQMPEIIRFAREFGASSTEINTILGLE